MTPIARRPVQLWRRSEEGAIYPARVKVPGGYAYHGPIFEDFAAAEKFLRKYGDPSVAYVLVEITPPGTT